MDQYDVKEIIADVIEGFDQTQSAKTLFIAVLKGAVHTGDGLRRYYIDLDTLMLQHIDLSEAIWSCGVDKNDPNDPSEIIFFDQLNDLPALEKKISLRENGKALWQNFQVKILSRIADLIG